MTTYSGSSYTSAMAPCANNGFLAIPFSITPAGAATTGDILNLCKYPAGYKPVMLMYQNDKAVATTGGTVKLGTNDGTTDDDDSLLASTVATSALTKAFYFPATPTQSVGVTTVYATLGVTSGASSDITHKGVLFVTPFQV